MGRALDELREFPADAKHDSGVELQRVQRGLDPSNWKPMPSVGPGVREIRVKTAEGIFRTVYTTVIGEHLSTSCTASPKRPRRHRSRRSTSARSG